MIKELLVVCGGKITKSFKHYKKLLTKNQISKIKLLQKAAVKLLKYLFFSLDVGWDRRRGGDILYECEIGVVPFRPLPLFH